VTVDDSDGNNLCSSEDIADTVACTDNDAKYSMNYGIAVERGQLEDIQIYSFESVFKGHVQEILGELRDSLSRNDGLFESSLFDSIIVEIEGKTVSQTKVDFGCILAATDVNYYPGMQKKQCY
jgi:hypothetical protein